MDRVKKYAQSLDQMVHLLDKKTEYSYKGHWQKMCLFFQTKEVLHAKSILTLGPAPDILLITRSMIEGISLLNYAGHEKMVRSTNWVQSYWIKRYKNYLDLSELGVDHPPGTKEEFENLIRKNCESLLCTKKARSKVEVNGNFYFLDWYKDNSISGLVKTFGDRSLKAFWSDTSGWHHWDVHSLADSVEGLEERFFFGNIAEEKILRSLACAITCLGNSIVITARSFGDTQIEKEATEIIKEKK